MGKRGPKPTPTAILRLRGSWRANERENEPATQPEAVACPEWVSPKVRQHWDDLCPMLVGWGVMAKVYGLALALVCDAAADWIELTGDVDNARPDEKGPLRKAKDAAWKRCMAACIQFGLTPAAVTAIRKVESKPTSKLDKYKIA